MLLAAIVATPIAGWSAAPALADPVALAAGIGVGLASSVIPYVFDQLAMAQLSRRDRLLMVSLLPATATVVGIGRARPGSDGDRARRVAPSSQPSLFIASAVRRSRQPRELDAPSRPYSSSRRTTSARRFVDTSKTSVSSSAITRRTVRGGRWMRRRGRSREARVRPRPQSSSRARPSRTSHDSSLTSWYCRLSDSPARTNSTFLTQPPVSAPSSSHPHGSSTRRGAVRRSLTRTGAPRRELRRPALIRSPWSRTFPSPTTAPGPDDRQAWRARTRRRARPRRRRASRRCGFPRRCSYPLRPRRSP